MKKFACLLLCACIFMGLTACSRDVENKAIKITLGEETLSGNKPDQEGAFVADEGGWSYQGTWKAGEMTDAGVFTDKPLTLTLGDNPCEGTYTGAVTNAVPSGEGTFTAKEGWTYEGNFVDGAVQGKGKVSGITLDLSTPWGEYKGTYEGALTDGLADGEGTFISTDDGGEWRYTGEFTKSVISGAGKVENKQITVLVSPDLERIGQYTGELLDGLPEGEGVFLTQNAGGENWTHTGSFQKGLFHGRGRQEWESGQVLECEYVEFGQAHSQGIRGGDYVRQKKTSSDQAAAFLEAHPDLFPAESAEAAAAYTNTQLEVKRVVRAPEEYGSELLRLNACEVLWIQDGMLDFTKFSYFVCISYDALDSCVIIIPEKRSDIAISDKITVYGLPIDKEPDDSGFEMLVLFASYIEK